MIRLHLVVEGQTEETFVRDVLSPELASHSVFAVAHQITTSRSRGRVHRGGLLQYTHLRLDLALWMKQDRNREARFTTMIDLYRMPPEFPGFEESKRIGDPLLRAGFLEGRFASDIGDPRFVPYIQVHEFEALLFSDPAAFNVAFPDATTEVEDLKKVAESALSPEHIDDGPFSSPAARIVRCLPGFAKAVHGPLIAAHIGLSKLRRKCKHFNDWYSGILKMVGSPDFDSQGEAASV